MPVTELNHYFVRANDVERTKDFYCDVLGFSVNFFGLKDVEDWGGLDYATMPQVAGTRA